MIHGDYVDYVRTSGIDSVTEYELWWAIWSSINSSTSTSWQWTRCAGTRISSSTSCRSPSSNHDVTRVASQIDEPRHRRTRSRCSRFLPGVPSVYYGDEFGLEAVKRTVRAGTTPYARAVGGPGAVRDPHPEVEADLPAGDRAAPPAPLAGRRGDHDRAGGERGHLVVRARARHGDDSLALALNLSDTPFALPPGADPGGRARGRTRCRGPARLGDRRRLTGCGAPTARTGPAGGVGARSWESQDAGATRRPRRP